MAGGMVLVGGGAAEWGGPGGGWAGLKFHAQPQTGAYSCLY